LHYKQKPMKKTGILISLVFSVFLSVAQKDMQVIQEFDGHFSMSIAKEVKKMSDEQILIKYHTARNESTTFYSTSNTDYSIVLNIVANNIKEAEMVKHKAELLAGFENKYKLVEDEVRKINGHDFIIIAFYSETPDAKVFNKRFFAVVNEKLVSVIFNCTEEQLKKRGTQIEGSINSVTIQ
jgi:hypothetical protein